MLDRNYNGLVLALDARIHSIVRQVQKTADDASRGTSDSSDTIIVRSPQFIDAVWEYTTEKLPNLGGIRASQVGDGPKNPFVETALNYALTYVSHVTGLSSFGALDIMILADNDYYSETETSRESKKSRFANFGVKLQDAHKTGLGSSAALVTSLTSAITLHHALQTDSVYSARDRLHNLAQAAHCAAQGKIGSGFDIAAAVYGTCRYRRFSPSILEKVGDFGSDGFADRLFSIVEDVYPDTTWDAEICDIGLKLPRGLQMVLCDVDCGSQTPGMVRKVLQWRKDSPEEAEMIWDELQRCNDKLREEIINTATMSGLASFSSRPPTASSVGNQKAQGPPLNVSSIVSSQQQQQQSRSHNLSQDSLPANGAPNFQTIAEALSRIRFYLKTMTSRAKVPIEPPAQTRLLDGIIESVDGIVGGVVPGAGGYDAIALLVHSDVNVLKSLRTFLSTWETSEAAKTIDEFGGKVERVRLLNVVHGSDGMRMEKDLRLYASWLE